MGWFSQDGCLKDSVIGRLSGFSDGWMIDLMCGSCLDAFTPLNGVGWSVGLFCGCLVDCLFQWV